MDTIKKIHGAKILLVEDEPSSQQFESAILKDHGFEVSIACNGQAALELLKQEVFDAVLMDCQMPIMDGYMTARKIRQQKHLKNLPIIAITANTMMDDRAKILAAGMNDIVPKPIIIAELFATMSKWIKIRDRAITFNEKVNIKESDENSSDLNLSTLNKLKLSAIDAKLGLELCDQNISLYIKLLDLFKHSQNEFAIQFNKAKYDNNYKEMKHLSHTLKGASSTISALNLQQAALNLELACSAENQYKEEFFSLLTIELNMVLADIKKLLSIINIT